MKALLLGANGQLGRAFLRAGTLTRHLTLAAASRDGMLVDGSEGVVADLSKPDSLLPVLDREQPRVIINAAAYTAVDRAEQEEDLANRVNGQAVGVMGRWAKVNRALVIHYSTDYVFDGEASEPYPVDAPTSPLGAYGRSKLLGETLLRESGADHLIFRTAWVYAPYGHNFLRTMLRLGSEREEVRVVADQRGAPTPAHVIAGASAAALNRWIEAGNDERTRMMGTHHLVADGVTSWHGFASAIFDRAAAMGLISSTPRVTPIESRDFPTPARRPLYSVLDNRGFRTLFGISLPAWQQGLDEVLSALFSLQDHEPC